MNNLFNNLKQLGIPVAYHHFVNRTTPTIPYLVYYSEGSEKILADNKIHWKTLDIVVELYNTKKDLKLEEKLENILDEMKLIYDKTETYISDEDIYMISYDFKLENRRKK